MTREEFDYIKKRIDFLKSLALKCQYEPIYQAYSFAADELEWLLSFFPMDDSYEKEVI